VAVGTAASHVVFDFHAALPCATMPIEQRGNTQLQPFFFSSGNMLGVSQQRLG
jgi:hypothetical protein